jgi:hypothetical protein
MYRRIPLSIEVKRVLKLLMATLCGMLIALSVYYFLKSSGTAEKGYLLRENQLRQKTLESENRILKQQVLDAQSIRKLEKSDVVSEMGPAEKPIYVEPKGPLTRRR